MGMEGVGLSVDTGIEEAVSSLEGTRCFARRQRQCIHFSVVKFFASFVIYVGRHDRGMHVLVECVLVTPLFADFWILAFIVHDSYTYLQGIHAMQVSSWLFFTHDKML
jgi:hypothetical protein